MRLVLGKVYAHLGDDQKALDYYNQALPIERQLPEREFEMATLDGIGEAYFSLGAKQKALDYYNEALTIGRQLGDRTGEATTLSNIGVVYAKFGEKRPALNCYNRALPIAAFVNDPLLQSTVFGDLADLEEVDKPSVAILYGKLAVNFLQQMRGNIGGLQDDLQKTFLASIAGNYRHLSAVLIKQGRLSKAQQVLNLLKAREYSDYVRGETNDSLSSLSLTPAEQSAEEDYQRSTAKVVEQGRRWSELKQNKARTPDEDKEFQQLSDSLDDASQMMNEYFAGSTSSSAQAATPIDRWPTSPTRLRR